MRWALALCVLATTVVHHLATAESRISDRAAFPHPLAIAARRAEVPTAKKRAAIPPAVLLRSEPPKSQRPNPEQVHPSIAMLGESGVVRGSIVDETGARIAVAKIRGMWSRGYCGHRGSRAALKGYGKDGEFVFEYSGPPSFPPLPPSLKRTVSKPNLTFTVQAAGYVSERIELTSEVSAALRRGESGGRQTIVLQRGARVEGAVVGPDGALVEHMPVDIVDDPLAPRGEYEDRAWTDAQGRFRLVDVDPRKKLWLVAARDDVILRPIALRSLRPDAESHYTLELEARRRVHVTIAPPVSGRIVYIEVDGMSEISSDGAVCRLRMISGPHHFKVLGLTNEGVKSVTFKRWIESNQIEYFERVRFHED